MSNRAYFTIIACVIFLASCRDTENREDPDPLNTEENEFSPVDRNIPREAVEDEDAEENDRTTQESITDPRVQDNDQVNINRGASPTLAGMYIKKGEESDASCACFCLDLSGNTAELCMVNGKMYVNTRLQKNPDNTMDVFLVEPSGRNTEGKDMPWKDFDRNSAIATIKPKSNGELELDWLGFKINGDLAIDYALFGKKTLEGDYKKK